MTAGPLALVFDFDGLIIDTEAAEYQSVAEVFAEHGGELDRHRWTSSIGRVNPQQFWVHWLEEQVGLVNREAVYAEQRIRNRKLVHRLPIKPGVEDLIAEADRRSVPCAVASASPSNWVLPNLERLGLLSRFVSVVSREQAKRSKPFPDPYWAALDAVPVPRVQAARCVAFEDSRNGSLAAIAAGLACVACPHGLTEHMDLSHATAQVSSLSEVTWSMLEDLTATGPGTGTDTRR